MENCNNHCNSIVRWRWSEPRGVSSNLFGAKISINARRVGRDSRKTFLISPISFVEEALRITHYSHMRRTQLRPCQQTQSADCTDVLRCANWIQANQSRVIPEIFGACSFLRGFVSDCGWSWRVLEREDFRTAFPDNRCLFDQAELRHERCLFSRERICQLLTVSLLLCVNFHARNSDF